MSLGDIGRLGGRANDGHYLGYYYISNLNWFICKLSLEFERL